MRVLVPITSSGICFISWKMTQERQPPKSDWCNSATRESLRVVMELCALSAWVREVQPILNVREITIDSSTKAW